MFLSPHFLTLSVLATAFISQGSMHGQSARADDKKVVERKLETLDENEFYPRVTVYAAPHFDTDNPQGDVRFKDNKGRLVYVETYERGVLTKRTAYYPNGKKFGENHFRNGVAHGVSKGWYPNGNLRNEIEWNNGEMHGRHAKYFLSGKKAVEAFHDRHGWQGKRVHFMPDGRVMGYSYWQNDEEVDRQGVNQPDQNDLEALHEMNRYSSILKHWWK